MTEFDRLYAEVKAEKIRRRHGLKKATKISKRLDMLCKGLDLFSKKSADGTIESIIKEFIK